MIDKKLKYEECLEEVRRGEKHLAVSFNWHDIRKIRDATSVLDELVRMSSVAKSGLFERGFMIHGINAMPLKPKDYTYERAEWIVTKKVTNNLVFADILNRLDLIANPLSNIIRSDESFNEMDAVTPHPELVNIIEETIKNLAEHIDIYNFGEKAKAEFDISNTGVIFSTYQMGKFDLKKELSRRSALPPDVTPHGKPIAPPRYWHAFENGEGFIRGNGMALMKDSKIVRINSRTEQEPEGPATRIYGFSNQHLSKS